MKYRTFILFCLIAASLGCNGPLKNEPSDPGTIDSGVLGLPQDTVDLSRVTYDRNNSRWKIESQPYSGYVASRFSDHSLKSIFGVLDGKKQNAAIDYYPDGRKKFSTDYHNGRIHGQKKSWTRDSTHTLVSSLNYFEGKPHGEQKQWYVTGEIFKIMNLNMGKEEGMQRAYRKNGDLFANYEARNGRIFGLKKTALCYGIEEDTIKYED